MSDFENDQSEPSHEAKDLYAKHLAQAWADQQASTDAFDNNLLTFSSGALGLSVAFIKDIVPLESVVLLCLLYTSWVAFSGCILVTIASFQVAAQASIAHQQTLADYYLSGDEKALKRKSCWSNALPWCAGVGSVLLLVGIVSTLLFAAKNINYSRGTRPCQTKIMQKN